MFTDGMELGPDRLIRQPGVARAEFTGAPRTQRYCRSPLFTGEPVPVVARFSLAGGDPGVGDSARSPRGMALEFQFADGIQHQTAVRAVIDGRG